jgi:hypothetical protein
MVSVVYIVYIVRGNLSEGVGENGVAVCIVVWVLE